MTRIKTACLYRAFREALKSKGTNPTKEEVKRRTKKWIQLTQKHPEDWAFVLALK